MYFIWNEKNVYLWNREVHFICNI